jgi:caffeoyl-CoA O-methyltransferase
MPAIVHPSIDRYLHGLIPPRDRVLAEMETRAGRERIPIVGPLVGRLFFQLARMVGARRVMELGSAIGYSTLWWARAIGPRGRVWYTDGDAANARDAAGYFRRARLATRVTVMVGDAVQSMAAVKGRFDIVFCDIDKHGYPAAFEAAWPRIRPGGLFVCDNTLWSGRVIRRAAKRDRDTAAIQRLNRMTFQDDAKGFAVLLPLRDGVTVMLKEL